MHALGWRRLTAWATPPRVDGEQTRMSLDARGVAHAVKRRGSRRLETTRRLTKVRVRYKDRCINHCDRICGPDDQSQTATVIDAPIRTLLSDSSRCRVGCAHQHATDCGGHYEKSDSRAKERGRNNFQISLDDTNRG